MKRTIISCLLMLLGSSAAPALADAPAAIIVTPRRATSSAHDLARLRLANAAARREPSAERFVNSTQVFSYSEGAIYRLYAAPGLVSDIALEPGETLVSVASGDTLRWIIGDTSSGSGASRRAHLLVKPAAAGLNTNLVIATDRRVYLLDLQSTPATAMAAVSWTYPESELLALKAPPPATEAIADKGDVDLWKLNFGYSIEGAAAPWKPLRAFDDGAQVFIEFPPGFASGDAPPLFVIDGSGKPGLVNYRVRGAYYVVDRLFDAAELRLGEKSQQVVRIRRLGSGAPQSRSRK